MEPSINNEVELTPAFIGRYWVEAEAMFPDGRRISAAADLTSMANYTLIVNANGVMTLSGPEGVSFSVEASTDLQEWIPVLNSIFTSDPMDFVDEGSQEETMRFYRLVAQP